jgi:hypothetical protein
MVDDLRTRLDAAKDRIRAMPEPQRNAAMHNYQDATEDLKHWPWLYDKIMTDLENALLYHEQAVNGEGR